MVAGLPGWSAIAESQVTNLVSDLAAKAPLNSPTFTGTVTLPTETVTLAQQAKLATVSLMGNPTGALASPSAITLGANLSFSGSTLVASGGSGMPNPMNTIGDMIWGTTTGSPSTPGRVVGNYDTTARFLKQSGNGVVASSPAWGLIVVGDVPSLPASQITSGQLAIAQGGTGQASAAAAYNALSPMTTLGDLEYESGANTASRLAGNISATTKFLAQTGNGTISAAPGWALLTAGDVPALPASKITSGQIPVAQGGTGLGTLTANSVLLGEGTGNVGFATIGTAGRALIDQGAAADPGFKAISGDATLSAAGALTVSAGAITLAKQANLAASSLVGNPTGSAAAPSAVTLGANMAFSGTTVKASPSGSTGQVQFNNASAFAGSAGVTTDGNDLTLANNLNLPASTSSAIGVINKGGSSFIHDFVGTGPGSNLFIGAGSGNFTYTTCQRNTGIGPISLASLTTGSNNTAIGPQALQNLTTGSNNVAIGPQALAGNTTPLYNVAVGTFAGMTTIAGSNIVAIGFSAFKLADGSENVVIGPNAMSASSASGVNFNVAIGSSALVNNAGGSNTGIGQSALYNISNGSNNTALGFQAGFANSTGSNNIFIGYKGGGYETGSNTIIIDNQNRSSEATARKTVAFYSVTSTTLSNQSVQLTGGTITVSSGSTAACGLDYAAWSSTNTQRPCGTVEGSFNTTTDASWSGNLKLYANDVTAPRLGIQLQSNGSVPLLGFYGATPVVKPATTGTTTGFTAGGTAVGDSSTFTGNLGATAYRISDIVRALKQLGLLAQ